MSLETYKRLIQEESIYPACFVQRYGCSGKHWISEDWKEREISLRHDLVCVYLSNLEPAEEGNILDRLNRGYTVKRKSKETPSCSTPVKLFKSSPSSLPSTSTNVGTMVSNLSGSSSSDASTASSQIDPELYRFIVIEGHPTPENLQSHYAKMWNILPPTSLWDIIDTNEKKFIEVKVSLMYQQKYEDFLSKISSDREYYAMVIVNPNTGHCKWFHHNGKVRGEAKVRLFLIARKTFLISNGVIESHIHEFKNPLNEVMCSSYLNELYKTWSEDWLKEEDRRLSSEELQADLPAPEKVFMYHVHRLLSDLKEENRTDFITWRGKILPESFVFNFKSYHSTDRMMIDEFLKRMPSDLKSQFINYKKDHEWQDDELATLIETWNLSEGNNFRLFSISKGYKENILTKLLGVGQKKKTYDPSSVNCKVPERKPISPLKYHCWFDEVLRGMRENNEGDGFCYYNLREEPTKSGHPIGEICESMTTKFIEIVTQRKVSSFSSKITNLSSRLGGSYLVRKNSYDWISIMPIYSTMYKKHKGTIQTWRFVSGVCLRGPMHARFPTDRIPILTIETVSNNLKNRTFLKYLNKARLRYNKDVIYVVRQNSLMKEDPSYQTFNANAFFVPLNMLGAMTLENPDLTQNADIRRSMDFNLFCNTEWLLERAIEGVLMSAIGNSRDEGYLASFRKIFMLVFVRKRNSSGASWDIEGLCSKMNECLLDNPLSMHFHRTLLNITREYAIDNV